MYNLGDGMKKIMAVKFVESGECPKCGEQMLSWKEKPGDPPRAAPCCIACGHRENFSPKSNEILDMETESRRSIALGYLKKNSIIRDKSLFRCTFDTFDAKELEQATALDICKRTADNIASGKNMVLALAGNVGTGKSHLSMAVLYEVIKKTKYKSKCLFVDYAAFLNEMKFAMDDRDARKSIEGFLKKEIEKADVVVIDDIGAEIGDGRDRATPYNVEQLTDILNSRKGKSLVFTTNLSDLDIQKFYGERVSSRLLDRRNIEVVTLRKIKDFRKYG